MQLISHGSSWCKLKTQKLLCRVLYWTDSSETSPAICRSSVVNPARQILITGNLGWPNALAIDFTGTLFYVSNITGPLADVGVSCKSVCS